MENKEDKRLLNLCRLAFDRFRHESYDNRHKKDREAFENKIITLIESKSNINAKTKTNSTPLIMCCAHGYKNAVFKLVDAKCDINAKNSKGNTALSIALICNRNRPYETVINKLLKNGADIYNNPGIIKLLNFRYDDKDKIENNFHIINTCYRDERCKFVSFDTLYIYLYKMINQLVWMYKHFSFTPQSVIFELYTKSIDIHKDMLCKIFMETDTLQRISSPIFDPNVFYIIIQFLFYIKV